MDLGLGIFLLFGTLISFLPQIIKIYARKSHRGISYLFCFLSSCSELIRIANIVVIKLPQIYACHTEGISECGDTMLSLFGLGVSAACTVWIFFLFLFYFDPDGTPEMDAIGARARVLARVCFTLVSLFYLMAALFVSLTGVCSRKTLLFADLCGWVSAVFQVCQLMPQIIHTYVHKGVGSVSILTLFIQAPGGYLLVYFLLAAGENISTWFSVLIAATMQTILLTLCLKYKYQRRGDNKYWFLDSTEDEEDESKYDTMPFGVAHSSVNSESLLPKA